MIEQLKPEQDYWIDENGTSYDTKKDYLQQEILGFCGCGNPDNVMLYVRDFLIKIESKDYGNYGDMPYMFIAYWADHNEFTEHGVSIRCAWLTDKGKELLSDIKWCLENELKK